jgi:deoxyadenosine/deoxycytidine kinase
MIIVGFMGNICTGKTTAAQYASETFGGRTYSLAWALKMIVEKMDMPKTRDTLVNLGESMKLYMGNSIFVEAALRNISTKNAKDVPVFIDDVRFPYEAKAIEEAGGTIIYIDSDLQKMWDRYEKRNREIDTISSYEEFVNYLYECPSERFAYLYGNRAGEGYEIISNRGNLEEFRDQVERMIVQILSGSSPALKKVLNG